MLGLGMGGGNGGNIKMPAYFRPFFIIPPGKTLYYIDPGFGSLDIHNDICCTYAFLYAINKLCMRKVAEEIR